MKSDEQLTAATELWALADQFDQNDETNDPAWDAAIRFAIAACRDRAGFLREQAVRSLSLEKALKQPISVWILTSSYNLYDQMGHYFEGVFFSKPTVQQIKEALDCGDQEANTLHEKGIYSDFDNNKYYLKEEKSNA